tara:strand:+ start:164 stop:892 length:729 start_codon:yes stop_codon:yes gene_type:complete
MNYKLPKQARELVLYQRTGLLPKNNVSIIKKILKRLRVLDRDKEYKKFVKNTANKEALNIDIKYFSEMKIKVDSIINHIPKGTSSILDIGCGIAGLDIILNEYFNFSKIYLLDKTQIEETIWYGFKEAGAFYNSLELAKETLVLNNVEEKIIELIDAPNNGLIALKKETIDLVVSTISWGFHYPIDFYLKSVFDLLNKNGLVILDLRLGKSTEKEMNYLSEKFHVDVISEGDKMQTIKCKKR